MFRSFLQFIWYRYRDYVETVMQSPLNYPVQDIDYWQKRLFTNVMLYALPLSLLALVPSVYIEYLSGNKVLASIDVLSLATVVCVVLNRHIALYVRKIVIAAIIVLFAIALTALFGSFSMGCIYLFSLSVFIALQFSDRVAYGTVAFNFLFCLGFALVIYYKLLNIPLIHTTTLDRWIVFSINFLFMDLVVVSLIRQILNGLVRTMHKEGWLHNQLQDELAQKASLNQHLKNSEEDYRTLFFHSPSPKLIFDMESLQFLQVNEAAIRTYGYTEQEFLSMKLTHIHPDESITEMLKHVHDTPITDILAPYHTQHLGKGGKLMQTEVRRSNITYKGKRARMIVTTDITQSVEFTAAIQAQNNKLRQIAYMQSHVIRLPLARIMSLSELIAQEYNGQVDQKLLDYLNLSANELDGVIREIVSQSTELLAAQAKTKGL